MSEDTWPVKVENGLAMDERPEVTSSSESSILPPPTDESTLEPTSSVKMENGNGHGIGTKDLFSGSTPPPALPASSSRSRSPSPDYPPSSSNGKKTKKDSSPKAGPILIDNLPIAWDEAHETFETLEKCVYERKDLGTSKESEDMMVCDCTYDKRESNYHDLLRNHQWRLCEEDGGVSRPERWEKGESAICKGTTRGATLSERGGKWPRVDVGEITDKVDDSSAESCADNSTCINRALFIECLASECRAKSQCRNQR